MFFDNLIMQQEHEAQSINNKTSFRSSKGNNILSM